ncbi:MAG TPA: hypothetical protein VM009_07025 [Terriglobales bacterium]|nr:hypothetical protein [Terriglobales bacterium]
MGVSPSAKGMEDWMRDLEAMDSKLFTFVVSSSLFSTTSFPLIENKGVKRFDLENKGVVLPIRNTRVDGIRCIPNFHRIRFDDFNEWTDKDFIGREMSKLAGK